MRLAGATAGQEPHVGTPVQFVTMATEQTTALLDNGVSVFAGVNPAVARLVAEWSGDVIAWPFSTVGFQNGMAPEAACFVLHGMSPGEHGPRLEVSAQIEDFHLSRPVLDYLTTLLFDDMGAAEILVRVRPSDADTRRTLLRLGFMPAGRELRPFYPFGLIYALRASRLPARFRRRRLRRRS